MGRGLRSLNRFDEALAIQQQLEGAGDGYVEEEIGECLLALGRVDEAKPYFARAYTRLTQDDYLVKHEGARLERLRSLGV